MPIVNGLALAAISGRLDEPTAKHGKDAVSVRDGNGTHGEADRCGFSLGDAVAIRDRRGRALVVDEPQVVAAAGELFVIGSTFGNAPTGGPGDKLVSPVGVRVRDFVAAPLPAPEWLAARPVRPAGAALGGVLALVWADSGTAPSPKTGLRRLWTATYGARRGWSRPTLLMAGDRLSWSRDRRRPIFSLQPGLAIVVSGYDSTATRFGAIALNVRGEWSMSTTSGLVNWIDPHVWRRPGGAIHIAMSEFPHRDHARQETPVVHLGVIDERANLQRLEARPEMDSLVGGDGDVLLGASSRGRARLTWIVRGESADFIAQSTVTADPAQWEQAQRSAAAGRIESLNLLYVGVDTLLAVGLVWKGGPDWRIGLLAAARGALVQCEIPAARSMGWLSADRARQATWIAWTGADSENRGVFTFLLRGALK